MVWDHERRMKMKKKMYRVLMEDGDVCPGSRDGKQAIGETEDEAITNVYSLSRDSGSKFEHWADLRARGYRVEKYCPEPDIDWEAAIIECMQGTWGSPKYCVFCLAVGHNCGNCLFYDYVKDGGAHPDTRLRIESNSPCLITLPPMDDDAERAERFSPENVLPVLAHMLVWYRNKKAGEK
jgi:hypothetical protein